MIVDPKEVSTGRLHAIMLGAIAPRPIAFASTIDKEGNVNLSPYSFFNAFGSNPPTLIFSPARRVRDNTIKHTLENVMEVPEVVINVVNFNMVQQMSLSSTEYPKEQNEFIKAGFIEVPSSKIKPPRVKESPVQFECIVKDIIHLGNEGGAGNLIVCEIVMIHIHDDVLDINKGIDQKKIDLVSRMGGNWYCRAHGDALFEVEKPISTLGIGVDSIPQGIRLSPILTGNNLGQLGNVESLPSEAEINEFKHSGERDLLINASPSADFASHRAAAKLLEEGDIQKAWLLLLSDN
jgi:flavin reductase (DIM6/NTAB) family NADH-FMN oxidoreductase RutF